MIVFASTLRRSVTVLAAVSTLIMAPSATGQILPWEVTIVEIEAGRLRHLAQRLNKENVLYHLRVGNVTKEDMMKTAADIDKIILNLEEGVPARSIPAPWTKAVRKQVDRVDSAWSPLRAIAVASPYEQLRVAQEFIPRESRRGDPLLLRYFDGLTEELVKESEQLISAYDTECMKTGLEVCATARSSGYAAMLIERATKEAVFVVAGIDTKASRKQLRKTIDAYVETQRINNESPFFRTALNPERGISAKAAGQLLGSLRGDWDVMQDQFTILAAGDESNFDLRVLLGAQSRMVDKVERLTAALVRYANVAYGS
jgi:hypothetical protein